MSVDHRPAVAVKRREKMRSRLIESAVLVVASKGMPNTVIDDIVAQAGVSRGTFYNHFSAVPDLMLAAQDELSNEILYAVEGHVRQYPRPDMRLALGIFCYIQTATAYPLVGHFVYSLGGIGLARGNAIYQLLPEHLNAGIETGDFCDVSMPIAFDLLASTVSSSLLRSLSGEKPDYRGTVAALLRGFGVDRVRAHELSQLQATNVVLCENGLVARSNAIWQLTHKAKA
ncbi:TetR/AcrR family transcriptional regulator [Albirhodobacter sp. R86504]|jgi:AcrR family transcriptional regulator|uniref:TetR/AcrR family transcriptional regulator n=1 Tax=Albirhodobacter sp. R86504 TaxID=3093848 RepID=UPI003671234F